VLKLEKRILNNNRKLHKINLELLDIRNNLSGVYSGSIKEINTALNLIEWNKAMIEQIKIIPDSV
jgi:hypothetical protein